MSKQSSQPAAPESAASQALVTIICRSIGRPELAEALRSVAAQTYPDIELLLVAAAGQDLDPDSLPLPVRVLRGDGRLNRPAAANLGLSEARGDYLLFLDEDDWIAPGHVESLLNALESDASAIAAYSNTVMTSPAGEELPQRFARDWDPDFLRRDNYLPIHSVLFRAAVRERDCRFDETLEIYEDWDFWLQVAALGDFHHVDETSAYYRAGGQSETAVVEESDKYRAGHANALAREKVFEKWKSRWSGADINRMLGSADETRQALQQEFERAVRDKQEILETSRENSKKLNDALAEKNREVNLGIERLAARDRALESANRQLREQRQDLENLGAQHQRLLQQHEELDRGVKEILDSFSWRVTRPYRFVRHRLRRLLSGEPLSDEAVVESTAGDSQTGEGRNEPDSETGSGGEHGGEKIHCQLDSPSSDQQLFSENMVLQGWALAPSGVATLTVTIDDLEYRSLRPGVSRPDVARLFPHLEHAPTCGFYERLPLLYLETGEHELRLAITSPDGNRRELQQTFYLFKSSELYNAWLQCREQSQRQEAAGLASELAGAGTLRVLCQLDGSDAGELTLNSLARDCGPGVTLTLLGDGWQEALASHPDLEDYFESVGGARGLGGLDRSDWADEDWILFIRPGQVLSEQGLLRLRKAAEIRGSDLVYSDHDLLDEDGQRHSPVFTWQWSPEQLISHNYVGDLFLLRYRHWRDALDASLASQALPSAYGRLLDLTLAEPEVQRVAEPLWSRRQTEDDGAAEKESEVAALQAFIASHDLPAELEIKEDTRSLRWELEEQPLVSIVIPTMGKLSLVQPCLDSLLEGSDYPNFEVIILDNSRGANPEGIAWLRNKGLTVIECNEAFNWARLNNRGAEAANGDYLLFLNDDIEIPQPDWLEELMRQAQRDSVGAVGCKLLYPNGALQHAGVFLVNYGGGGLHLFHKLPPGPDLYQRLDLHVREVSAVTGACLLVSRAKFDEVRGFDEELAVVGNDVDFCLRLRQKGYRNIWTPRCTLIHHESISRESIVPREDEQALWRRWGELFLAGDPYYNPNLTLTKWDCSQDFDVPGEKLLTACRDAIDEAPRRAPVERVEGVNLIGYIRADMGLGEAVRADARALEAAAVDFGVINFETGNPGRMTNLTWRHKEMLSAPFDINLIHINGDMLPIVKSELPDHFFQDRMNIAYWAWELERIPDDWLASLSLVEEIWTPSRFVQEAVQRATDKPVHVIPHNVENSGAGHFDREHFRLPAEAFVFLAMYDTRSIAMRKNPQAVVRAFKQAFAGDDHSVCLLLKLNNATSTEVETLQAEIASHGNILISDANHSRAEIDSLLQCIDSYVSLHRSEGFGLGPAEAMSLGVPCILTNWSGNTDYMSDDNCLAVDYELVELEQDYGPYNRGQRWAEADVEQAAAHMRSLARDPALAASVGAAARQTIEERFSPAAVGQLMSQRLAEIRAERKAGSNAEPVQTPQQ